MIHDLVMDSDNLRKRKLQNDLGDDQASDSSLNQTSDVPQSKDDTPEFMKDALKNLPPKWKNWWIRGVYSVFMILSFFIIVYSGHVAIVAVIFLIQFKCFHEIITIGHQVYKSYDLPWFRSLSWCFLLIANYYFYGETLNEYFGRFTRTEPLMFFFRYHRMISFGLYLIGFMLFVLSLVKKMYRLQFFMFGWTHVTLLIIVTQAHLIIQNLYEGFIWLIVPVSMVIINDIMAYICGFFMGRTPLIKLSPKKTWEGFIGGGIWTVIFGWMLAGFLSQFSMMVCPIEVDANFSTQEGCEISSTFLPMEYDVPLYIQVLLKVVGLDWTTVNIIPFQLHSLAFSLFAAVIAPFGGFFASGFKRAFKIKDFGDVIPGHGGMMDRFDCQFLMATFVHVYLSTFIRVPSPRKLLPIIFALKPQEQEWILEELQRHLQMIADNP